MTYGHNPTSLPPSSLPSSDCSCHDNDDDDDEASTCRPVQQLKGLTCSHNKGAGAGPACTRIKCVWRGGGRVGVLRLSSSPALEFFIERGCLQPRRIGVPGFMGPVGRGWGGSWTSKTAERKMEQEENNEEICRGPPELQGPSLAFCSLFSSVSALFAFLFSFFNTIWRETIPRIAAKRTKKKKKDKPWGLSFLLRCSWLV